ncbi:MAG: hypothetical protein QXS16_01025 [Pyrobaculum sp.]
MDSLSLEILKTFLSVQLTNEEGATVYRVMKKLNLYPSFIYKLIRKLENSGYIKCEYRKRGRVCKLTFLGMFEIYKRDVELRVHIEKLMSRCFNIRDVESLRRILLLLVERDTTPRSFPEFVGYLFLFLQLPEATRLLQEVANAMGVYFVPIVNIKVDGFTHLSCEKKLW